MSSTDRGLVRGLRRWDLVALVINSVIGSGIFGLPSRVYALAGTYSLLAYALSAIAVLLIVLCFAEVASRFKGTGGPYLYARAAFGPIAGFEVGWLLWLGRIASSAANCNLGVGYLAFFIPAVASGAGRASVIVGIILLLTLINARGVRATATATNMLTIGKLIPLVLFVGVGLFFVSAERYTAGPFSAGAVSQASLLLVFAYTGFEAAVIPAGEMRDPGRHLPFALITGIAVVVVIYVLVQTVCIGTLPSLASSERPLADASRVFLGPIGAVIVAAGALVSISGTLNAQMFANSRLIFGLAEQGQLPAAIARIHARFQTPVFAILLTAMVTLPLALSSTFLSAVTISTVIRLLAYGATAAALLALRARPGSTAAPTFRAPFGVAVAWTALILSVWLLSNSTWTEYRLVLIAAVIGLVAQTLRAKDVAADFSRPTSPD